MSRTILTNLPEEIIGERVMVRPYRVGDGQAMFDAIAESRETLRAWMPFADEHQTVADSEEVVRRSLARWLLREDLPMGIWLSRTGQYLGGTGLHRFDIQVGKYEIGYWMRTSAHGQGYATETALILTDFAFGALQANRVMIRCSSDNVKSAAVPKRLGFVHEGTMRNDGRKPNGDLYDMEIYALTRTDWEGLLWSSSHPPLSN